MELVNIGEIITIVYPIRECYNDSVELNKTVRNHPVYKQNYGLTD
ncbi:hypothetical protein [Geosporobacter ferrireducens]|nr:hypothetical protein [Geosporobacter ferrireducens]